jgi:hypothetical protein
MVIKNWCIEEMTGYKPITTFWQDFSIAELFGKNGILDTFKRAFKEWKSDYEYLTELVMVMNWKMWQYEQNKALCELYYNLWLEADEYARNNLKDEELSYYYRITD